MDPTNLPRLLLPTDSDEDGDDRADTTARADISSSSAPGVTWSGSHPLDDLTVDPDEETNNLLSHLRSLEDIMKEGKGLKRPKSTRTDVHDRTPHFPKSSLRPRLPNAGDNNDMNTRGGIHTNGFGSGYPAQI